MMISIFSGIVEMEVKSAKQDEDDEEIEAEGFKSLIL